MEELNRTLFLAINAPAHAGALVLAIAQFLADYVVWSIPAILLIGWLRGRERARLVMLRATAAGLAGLLINQVIALFWNHPRPSMIGLGHTYVAHAPDSSFPSDHLTLIWAVAFSFVMHPWSRPAGIALALFGLPVAWARIYLGIHFPLDMAGAASVALASAWWFRKERMFVVPLYGLAMRVYCFVFSPFIQRGWVEK